MEPKKGIKPWQSWLILIALIAALVLIANTKRKPEPEPEPLPTTQQQPPSTPNPAPVKPVESPEAARLRKDCENERYLADRRKLADWTPQDFAAIRACDQLGY